MRYVDVIYFHMSVEGVTRACWKIRYHHDGKYNVMSLDGPCEVYGALSFYFLSGPGIELDIFRAPHGTQWKSQGVWISGPFDRASCT